MQIPTTASGQRLVIGFGADQQVRTRRELVDKFDELQGGNRQLKFVYRLVLSNFKDQPVTVRLILETELDGNHTALCEVRGTDGITCQDITEDNMTPIK